MEVSARETDRQQSPRQVTSLKPTVGVGGLRPWAVGKGLGGV